MSIVGKLDPKRPTLFPYTTLFRSRASDLLISDGAQVEGNVIAQNVTVWVGVTRALRPVSRKLQDGAAAEGDIFHRSLSIDENSQFEGSSRRVENPIDSSSRADPKG